VLCTLEYTSNPNAYFIILNISTVLMFIHCRYKSTAPTPLTSILQIPHHIVRNYLFFYFIKYCDMHAVGRVNKRTLLDNARHATMGWCNSGCFLWSPIPVSPEERPSQLVVASSRVSWSQSLQRWDSVGVVTQFWDTQLSVVRQRLRRDSVVIDLSVQ
jgi:hypothetical protein